LFLILQIVATTCFFLACKVEEAPIRIESIIDHYLKTRAKFSNEQLVSLFLFSKVTFLIYHPCLNSCFVGIVEQESKAVLIDKVKVAERILLHTLCFDLVVRHPYSFYKKAMNFLRGNVLQVVIW